MRRAAWALVMLAMAGGCENETERARAACHEVAAAFASRCPDGDAEEEGWNLGCDVVDSVRDREALLDECVPAIRALPCGQEGPLPEACEDQLRIE